MVEQRGREQRPAGAVQDHRSRLEEIRLRGGAVSALGDAKRAIEDALRLAELALDEAEAASQAKSVFLATVSHELRTPLNVIVGFSNLMMKGLLKPTRGVEQPLEYAGDINSAGMQLLGLINDILDLTRAGSGAIALEERWLDLYRLADSATELVQDRAADACVALSCSVCDAPPMLLADRGMIMAIANVLANAVKFTPQGGTVRLSADVEEKNGLVIVIADTGIGIEPKNFARVLEPFAQLDSGLDRGHSGTGIGLSLSKALVELHGGSLDIESELGTGTTVTIRLPAERLATNASAVAGDDYGAGSRVA